MRELQNGQALIPILEKGADGIDKLNKGISENLILSEDARQAAEDYKISTAELPMVTIGSMAMVIPLLSRVTDFGSA